MPGKYSELLGVHAIAGGGFLNFVGRTDDTVNGTTDLFTCYAYPNDLINNVPAE